MYFQEDLDDGNIDYKELSVEQIKELCDSKSYDILLFNYYNDQVYQVNYQNDVDFGRD